MKNKFFAVVALVVFVSFFVGCGSKSADQPVDAEKVAKERRDRFVAEVAEVAKGVVAKSQKEADKVSEEQAEKMRKAEEEASAERKDKAEKLVTALRNNMGSDALDVALELITVRESVPLLIKEVKDAENIRQQNEKSQTRGKAIITLRLVGVPAVRDLIESFDDEKNPEARYWAGALVMELCKGDITGEVRRLLALACTDSRMLVRTMANRISREMVFGPPQGPDIVQFPLLPPTPEALLPNRP